MLDAETQKDIDELHASFGAEEMLTHLEWKGGVYDPLAPVHPGGQVSIARYDTFDEHGYA